MTARKTTFKEAIDKIKKLLFDGEANPPGKTDYTLADGTNIKVLGELAEGTQVQVITDQGQTPIADGQYELADGTKFTCTGGVITEVEATQTDESQGSMAMKTKMEAQAKRIDALNGAVFKLQVGNRAQKEAVAALVEMLESLSDTASAAPVEKPANAFSKKAAEKNKMLEFTQALAKIKSNQ